MSTTSIRLPKDLEEALNKVVKLTKRTKSSLIKEALEVYVKKHNIKIESNDFQD